MILSGHLMHLVPGTILLLLGGCAMIVASMLFALAPSNASFWAWVFPAMLCTSLSIDLTFNVANVFFTTSLPAEQQGLAGALATMLIQLSISLLLGAADAVATYTADQGKTDSYRNVFWLNFACSAAALAVFALFVRIGRADASAETRDRDEVLTKPEIEMAVC